MTFPNLRPARAVSDQMIIVAGQFVQPSVATTTNQQILPSNLSVGSYGTSQLSPTATISPQGNRIPIFGNPNGSAAGSASNTNALPRGMSAGLANVAGSEWMLDFSAFNSDIIYAAANLFNQSRGPTGAQAYVSCVDNVNKLVYILALNAAGTTATAPSAGTIIAWDVILRDAFTP